MPCSLVVKFQRNILLPSSGLQKEEISSILMKKTADSSETAGTHQPEQCFSIYAVIPIGGT